jgi:hypothetical protein
MNKDLFYLVMAGIGGYAAWLAIQKHQQEQARSNWFIKDAFDGNAFDFYQPESHNWLASANPNSLEWYGI